MKQKQIRLRALRAAFPYTIPIFAGFWFLGLTYGISMLGRYKGTGWKKFYLIFGMCDESFSINYTADIPPSALPRSVRRISCSRRWRPF